MKKYFATVRYVTIILSILAFLSGCVTTSNKSNVPIQIEPNLHTVSTEDYMNGGRAIELPQNYSTKNYKRLIVSIWFYPNEDAHNYQDSPAETLSSAMETEISKVKRFTIVSRHLGQKGKMAEKNFQDMGISNRQTKMRFGKGLNADFSLTGGISVFREEYDRGSKNELVYIVRVDYQLVDNETDEIIEADMAEGRTKRTIMRLPSGKIIGGFSQEKEGDAYAQASINALRVIANKIGNKLPIGGTIVGFKGNRFMLDKGYEEGFMGKQTVTLYTSDMGIDLAFAVGEVNPGDHKTPGKIISWSKDPDVQDIIKALRANSNYIKENEVYAVSNGMPLPPEWENTYNN